MRALIPRIFDEPLDWLEADLTRATPHPIRVEDYRDKDRYVLRAELPGIDPDKDIKVTLDDGLLTVEAERGEQTHDKYHTEFRYGSLRRSVRLPAGADQSKIRARYDKGILEVTIPLHAPEHKGRAIEVTHGD